MKQAVLAGKNSTASHAPPAAATSTQTTGLRIGEANDAFEQEADPVAREVMDRSAPRADWSLTNLGNSTTLRRKCACGGTGGAGGECEECKECKEKAALHRRSDGHTAPNFAPPIVHEVLRSPGQPLDRETRVFFEPRFGYDFCKVRIHTDGRAAESARAVQALAYTVGNRIVFGAGQYGRRSSPSQALVAHELAHVVQQGRLGPSRSELSMGSADGPHERHAASVDRAMSTGWDQAGRNPGRASLAECSSLPHQGFVLQRACLSAADCAAPRSTLTGFVAQTTGDPEQVKKQKKREAACTKKPPDAACTADGHGTPATDLLNVLKANYPSRAGFITGIFVDKDIPKDWGAYTTDCSSSMPPMPGAKCTFVPDNFKAEGEQFQKGAATVGSRTRQQWLTRTIEILTHETEHARFDVAAPIAEPSATACKFADLEDNLSEMAARLSEMHVVYRDALARPDKDRFLKFHGMFNYWVNGGGEDISGIVKDVRCKCECGDADHYIKKTVESTSTNQKWDTNEQTMIHAELKQPKWGLKWPVDPPSAITVTDLPTVAPQALTFE